MIQPIKFCVPTMLSEHNCFSLPNVKLIALDIGYSGVKCFTEKLHACFPSLARRSNTDNFISEPNPDDILYRDETGVWIVGASALRGISLQDTNDSERTLYTRQRYDSDMFKVIFRVGMGICLMGEKEIMRGGGRPIHLQTGLPPAYIETDKKDLIDALKGKHKFSIKFGRKQWKDFCFDLQQNCIYIMQQPMGSLFSAAINDDGKQVAKARDYFNAGILGFDPGFGTVDSFVILGGAVKSFDSFDNLGMKMVYKRLAEKIQTVHGIYIPTHAIQKVLLMGYVQAFDKKSMKTENIPITDMLEAANKEIFAEAITKLKITYNYLQEFKYLLVAGGTGEAWTDYIHEHFSGMQNLKIILGNQIDPSLPQIFSNVRGYYFKRAGCLKRKI